jgi:hypothetical protein
MFMNYGSAYCMYKSVRVFTECYIPGNNTEFLVVERHIRTELEFLKSLWGQGTEEE